MQSLSEPFRVPIIFLKIAEHLQIVLTKFANGEFLLIILPEYVDRVFQVFLRFSGYFILVIHQLSNKSLPDEEISIDA